MPTLSHYEQDQFQRIRKWQAQGPDWGTRLLAKPGGKVAQAVQALVPVSALRAALDGVNQLALKLTRERSILKRAKVGSLQELRAQPLEVCDRLAKTESRRAMAMAGAGGAAFGVAGSAGLVADVPVLMTLALRTIHRLGLCYGEDTLVEAKRKLAIGIFALASANSLEEKQTALTALRGFDDLTDAAWRDGVERAAERELAKEAAAFSLQTLASRVGINLGRRKAAGMLPVVGALVGGSVNAWYLSDVTQVARYVFRERWLLQKYPELFEDVAPIPVPALAGPATPGG